EKSFLKQIEAEGILYYDARRWQRWARTPEAGFRRVLDALSTDTDGWTRVLDSRHVDSQVDNWICAQHTPEEQAEHDRLLVEAEAERERYERREELKETIADKDEDAGWATKVGPLWGQASGY